MPVLEISGLSKSFPDGSAALRGIDLALEEGQIVSLLGPSGCGKTTTLRCIAGLEEPDGGRIVVSGREVFGTKGGRVTSVPTEKRNLAMVFQQYALWPHYDVFDNVAFALRSRRRSKAEIEDAVRTALTRVALWDKRHRKISQLSGGQQQRVALARAFAVAPSVVLFDEPLSNLDARLREEMRYELVQLQQEIGFSAVYVTHDQEEALTLSSRIAVMNGGVIEQFDEPFAVWRRPSSAFVADFLGGVNRLHGRIVRVDRGDEGPRYVVDVGAGVDVVAEPGDRGLQEGDNVELYMREGTIALHEQPSSAPRQANSWNVGVARQSFHGDYLALKVVLGDWELSCRLARTGRDVTPSHLAMTIEPGDVLVYPLAEEVRSAAGPETSVASPVAVVGRT